MVEGYTNATINNKGTGNAPSKFEFFKEIGDLIGDRHDINFPGVVTQNKTTDLREGQDTSEESTGGEEEALRPDTPSSQPSKQKTFC